MRYVATAVARVQVEFDAPEEFNTFEDTSDANLVTRGRIAAATYAEDMVVEQVTTELGDLTIVSVHIEQVAEVTSP